MKNRNRAQRIASIGILSALSVVMALFLHFPMILPFLEMDFADVPIFVATFMYGPLTGLCITTIVCLVQGITVSFATGGLLGIFMHFFATGSFVIVAGNIYNKYHTFKGAIVSMVLGVITWVLVMIPFNLLITPLFMGDVFENAHSFQDVIKIHGRMVKEVIKLLPGVIAFNVIKSAVNSIVTLIIYKYIHKLFNKMLPEHNKKFFASKHDKTIDENVAIDSDKNEIVSNESTENQQNNI